MAQIAPFLTGIKQMDPHGANLWGPSINRVEFAPASFFRPPDDDALLDTECAQQVAFCTPGVHVGALSSIPVIRVLSE